MKAKAKPMPSLRSDAEAKQFVAKADLSQDDLSGFKPMRFEIAPADAAGSGRRSPPERTR
jgi:hypothetical protein